MEGLHQGDPLAGFIFSLGIQEVIEEMKSPYNNWYLDDGCLGGSYETVLEDFKKIIAQEMSQG